MVPFNRPCLIGVEQEYIKQALEYGRLCGDGPFTRRCEDWLQSKLNVGRALLTSSCTHALEMIALLLDVGPGDEVILPSYTFVSTANAFVLKGATIVFVDIDPSTMNIDADQIEDAITENTKAIVVVHYAGVSCDLSTVMTIGDKYDIPIVEDAAQGLLSSFKGKYLGSIGALSALSFHETKNYTSGGEGGALLINDSRYVDKAEVIREKGTNRSLFHRGEVDKYTWISKGSSYLMSELQAAYLWGQLVNADIVYNYRNKIWSTYDRIFMTSDIGNDVLPTISDEVNHNGHMYYIKARDIEHRQRFINKMKAEGVHTVFHYVPLHTAPAARDISRFSGYDHHTTKESERLVRLPLWYGLPQEDAERVAKISVRYLSEG